MDLFTLRKRGKIWHYYFSINHKVYRGSTHATAKELAILYTKKKYDDVYKSAYDLSSKSGKVTIKDFITLLC